MNDGKQDVFNELLKTLKNPLIPVNKVKLSKITTNPKTYIDVGTRLKSSTVLNNFRCSVVRCAVDVNTLFCTNCL